MEIDTFTEATGINQDRFVATPVARGALVVVCDGAGGMTHGGAAAECVVRELVIRAEHFGLEDLQRQVATLDQVLAVDPRCGETTCVALWVTPREIYGVSVGDSEAWWVGDDEHVALTEQQSRARLGSARARVTSFRRLRVGGSIVVATDGFFSYAPLERWLALVRSAPGVGVARQLVDLARLPNGRLQDDATAVVVTR